jgi:O-antigen/teichoic acid export membrane protein
MARTDRKIAANMLIVAVGKGLTAAAGLGVIALLTRHLGLEGFGEYRTVTAFMSFAYLTSDLGLYSYTLRAISEPGADKGHIVGAALKLRLILALVFLSAAWILSLGMPFASTVKIGIALSILGYLCHSGSDLLLAAFQRELRQYQFAMTEVVGGLVTLLAAYFIVVNDLGVLAAVAALVCGFVATFAINLAFIRRSITWSLRIDRRLVRGMLAGSMPFAGALIFSLIYSRLDIVFLSLLQSSGDVGIYGIAHKMSDVIMAAPYFFAGLVMPALTAAAVKNREKFAYILGKSYTAMCVGGVGAALLIVIFADLVIFLVAGDEYMAGTSALQIIGVKIGLFFVANLLIFTTTALNMQHAMLKGHGLAAAISVIAYVSLIPSMSFDGAAIAATVAEVVVLIFAFALITQHSGWVLSLAVPLKCLIAAAVSYLLTKQTMFASKHWAAQFLVAGLSYLILVVVLRTGAWTAFRELVGH